MGVHVRALAMELHLPHCRSLKDKRATLRPVLEAARHRFPVSMAEVGDRDLRQRATLGVATVAATPRQADETIDAVERFVWAQADVEVASAERSWLEFDR